MSKPETLDDRTFERATDLTPEEQAINAAHFEAKGYEVEMIPEDGDAPAVGSVPETPPAAAAPDGAAPEEVVEIDPESRAEWQSATNDGQKLGRLAKKTKKIKELTAAVTEKDARLSEKETRIQDLQRQLADRSAAPPVPLSVAQPPAPPQPETPAPQAKQFEKPRPVKPKIEDFVGNANIDNPDAAFAASALDYADLVSDWKDEKRAFDDGERQRVQQETSQRDQATRQYAESVRAVNQRFEDVRRDHPDFDTRTSAVPWTSTVKYLLAEKFPDGLKLAYELSKPENAEILSELLAKVPETRDANVALNQIEVAGPAALAVAKYRIDNRAPAAAPAVTAIPPQAPPSNQPPRREEAAPAPTRGRNVVGIRPEDVEPMDSDQRRALRGMRSAAVSVPQPVHTQRR